MHCNKCKRDNVLNNIILNHLIIIQKEYLNYENIDSIFIDKDLVKIYKNVPNAHKLIILKKTCNIYYDIVSISTYMLFILDVDVN